MKRLRVMFAREVAHRVVEQASLRAMRLRHALGWNAAGLHTRRVDHFSFCASNVSCLPDLGWDHVPDGAEAEELIAGRCRALGFDWTWRRDPSVWGVAPDTGRVWPHVFFGAIPYRQGNPYGDIRVAWEPSRLQHLVSLALIARTRDDALARRASRMLEDQFLSWVDANPAMTGIHYVSAMECALRVIAACHALDLARHRLERRNEAWNALVRLVANHAWIVERRLSRYSSANNHLIAEAAGLVYAGTLFPEFASATAWRKTGLSILEEQASRQILPDGGGAEQAFWYLLFVADLYGLVIRLLRYRQQTVPQAMLDASRRAHGFLNALADDPEHLPPVGDSDNGHALSPLLRISWEHELFRDQRLQPGKREIVLRSWAARHAALLRPWACGCLVGSLQGRWTGRADRSRDLYLQWSPGMEVVLQGDARPQYGNGRWVRPGQPGDEFHMVASVQ